jgi:1-acyl-sn-glycerol-3-phosphate acyltransferase
MEDRCTIPRVMRPRLSDIARTVRVAGTGVLPLLARIAMGRVVPTPGTGSERGRLLARKQMGDMLRAAGVDLEVLGAERVPLKGGLILMWNQESHLDHLVLAASIPRPFFSLFNNEVARFPFYGAHLFRSGHVHVDRRDERQWRPAIAAAAARVRERGECFLVSPEGTRSKGGALLPLKRGALLLATSSESPVVCVTVIGGHERLGRGQIVVRRGPMRVVFSDPIASRGGEESLRTRVASVFDETKRAFALNHVSFSSP